MLEGYKEYKNIPEFWLSSIPDNWDNIKIKHIFKERVEKGYPNKLLLAATQNMGVVPKNIYGNRTVEASKDFHLLKLVKTGDFVISLRSFQGGIEYAYYEGIISPAYTVMIPDKNNSHFFRYLFKSIRFIELLQNCVTGIREGQNIDYSKLREHLIPIPPRPEQDQIVRYLDWKVSMINKYINAKKKQIELLKERKQAIINQAVTKGLDTNVPMKDSGIEWLGKIPTHWDIQRAKNMYKKMNRPIEKNDEVITCFRDGTVTLRKNRRTTGFTESFKEIGYQGIKKGDLIIHVMDAFAGAIGVSDSNGKGTPVYTVCTAKGDYNNYYYAFLIRKMAKQGFIQSLYRGIRERSSDFRYEVFGKQILPVPPHDEQEKISVFCQENSTNIDNYCTKLQQQINFLQEYRTRLISDVVTGKVNVQNVKVPEFENTEYQESCDTDEDVE
jgi:type I restriction enzyme, S subunit